jgi:hypothetical protein
MIVTANTDPIALSIVEGCAQSPHSNVLTGKGISAKREGFSLLALCSLLFAFWSARLVAETFLTGSKKVLSEPSIARFVFTEFD